MNRRADASDPVDRSRVSRREFVAATAAGAGLTVLAGTALSLRGAAAGQIEVDIPVPVTPGVEPSVAPVVLGPTVASKAAELGFDTEKIFEFVRDDVRYEPYAGSLRGADGTLWALAGNSVDKALLMAALLDESLVEYRLAVGPLDTDQAESLEKLQAPTRELLESHYAATFIASTLPPSLGVLGTKQGAPVDSSGLVDATDVEGELDAMAVLAQAMIADANTLAMDQASLITDALDAAGVTIPEATMAKLPASERDRHVWVQVADGPAWVDYLPTMAPSVTPAMVETHVELPDDFKHMITISLVAEEVIGGAAVRRDVTSLVGPASALTNVPIGITALPPSDFAGLGLTINQLFTGNVTLVPILLAGDVVAVADVPIMFGGEAGSGGIFDDGTAVDGVAEGETLALWLSIDVTSPDAEPVHVERALFDRIGAEHRLAELPDLSDVKPAILVDFAEGKQTIAELSSIHILNVDVARLQSMYSFADAESLRTYGPVSEIGPGMTAFRDVLRVQSEIPFGYETFIAHPQLTLTTMSFIDPSDAESAIFLELDLLRNTPQVRRLVDVELNSGAHPSILAGVYDHIAERMSLAALTQLPESDGRVESGPTVSSIFAAAIEEGIPIRVVRLAEDLADLELSPVALTRLVYALAEGWIAIVPIRSVDVQGVARSGWWLVDPQSGQTRDQLDDGRSYAAIAIPAGTGLFSVSAERTVVSWISEAAARAFQFLGRKALCIFMLAGVAISSFAFGYAAAGAYLSGGGAYAIGAATSGWSAANAARQALAAPDGIPTC
ncbi:MAG: hypothetical protein WKF81_05795 [Thermomicrobiales bacterium]